MNFINHQVTPIFGFTKCNIASRKLEQQHQVYEKIQLRKEKPLLALMSLHIEASKEEYHHLSLHLKHFHSVTWLGYVYFHPAELDGTLLLNFQLNFEEVVSLFLNYKASFYARNSYYR